MDEQPDLDDRSLDDWSFAPVADRSEHSCFLVFSNGWPHVRMSDPWSVEIAARFGHMAWATIAEDPDGGPWLGVVHHFDAVSTPVAPLKSLSSVHHVPSLGIHSTTLVEMLVAKWGEDGYANRLYWTGRVMQLRPWEFYELDV